jgi:hypothetical protein
MAAYKPETEGFRSYGNGGAQGVGGTRHTLINDRNEGYKGRNYPQQPGSRRHTSLTLLPDHGFVERRESLSRGKELLY